jgi:predicted glycosyltransferase
MFEFRQEAASFDSQTLDFVDRNSPRVALYSPGIAGLGHMRRNMLIGQVLTSLPINATTLLIAEARQACAFALPPGMDCLALPALQKQPDGKCRPRYLQMKLGELINIRAAIIQAAATAFRPDVLIVDFLPLGRHSELQPTLESLLEAGNTRCVLGLREVLENPAWSAGAFEDEIRRYYDAVWVYGDPQVYNLIDEQHWPPDLAGRTSFTGYLDQRQRFAAKSRDGDSILDSLRLDGARLALCLVGGGGDGAALAQAFARADFPRDMIGVALTGPYMPPTVKEELARLAATHPSLRIVDFLAEPAPLIEAADRIVAMGGYNTVSEILSFEKPALVVPRSNPPEQFVRAERLRQLGLIDVLTPNEVTPRALGDWLARDLKAPRVHSCLDFSGLDRIPGLAQELLMAAETSRW